MKIYCDILITFCYIIVINYIKTFWFFPGATSSPFFHFWWMVKEEKSLLTQKEIYFERSTFHQSLWIFSRLFRQVVRNSLSNVTTLVFFRFKVINRVTNVGPILRDTIIIIKLNSRVGHPSEELHCAHSWEQQTIPNGDIQFSLCITMTTFY